jgi:hypothetical protein
MSAGIEIDTGTRDIYRVVQAIISLIRKWNASGTVTLRAGNTTTPVDRTVSKGAANVSQDDEIVLTARTANAAGAMANVYVSAIVQGGFTLTHSNTGTTDRTFSWASR